METKSLLYGLIGFFLGGLLVSVAATTFERPNVMPSMGVSMADMTEMLKDKRGDEFDKALLNGMIEHHEGAVEMAELSAKYAKHDEIKQLSKQIIESQQSEIVDMKAWQIKWGYPVDQMQSKNHSSH